MSRILPGLNIQWPWSQWIADGQKQVETRGYELPIKYQGCDLALIETPGPRGKREAGVERARIIGIVRFSRSYRYESVRHWAAEFNRHLVPVDDPLFSYRVGKPKWAWEIESFSRLPRPVSAPKRRGIVFTTRCRI